MTSSRPAFCHPKRILVMPMPRTPPIFKRRTTSADSEDHNNNNNSSSSKENCKTNSGLLNDKKMVDTLRRAHSNEKSSVTKGDGPSKTNEKPQQESSSSSSLSSSSCVQSSSWGAVGRLRLRLHRASGLPSRDFGRACSSCVHVTLGSLSLESSTVKRSADPVFDEVFVLPLDDITDVLYVDVVDQDRFHEPQCVAKLAIPILQIVKMEPNAIVSFWLKDKKLTSRCKGNNARVYMSFEVDYDFFKAALKTVSKPRTLISKSSFRRNTFINNVRRVKGIVDAITTSARIISDIFAWEDPQTTVKCFVTFELFVYFGEIYMLPILVILIIFGYPLWSQWIDLANIGLEESTAVENDNDNDDDNDDNDNDNEKNDSKGLGDKVRSIQEVSAYVQNGLGFVASTVERVVNTINFSVPFMSWLATAFLALVTLVLYLIPLRALIMMWGINKFSKKLINPNYKPESELLSFLSRVPDHILKRECEPVLPPEGWDVGGKDEDEERVPKAKKGKIAKKVSAFFSRDKESTNSNSGSSGTNTIALQGSNDETNHLHTQQQHGKSQ